MKLHLALALVSLAGLVSTALHELEPSDDLQATITSAAAGDRIELDAGRYTSSASDNAFTLDKSLTIVAKEGRKAILDGQNARRVLNLGSSGSPTNYVFEGLVLTNGLADEFGGALKISLPPDESGSITIDDCEVSSSSASQGEGGGLWFSVANFAVLVRDTLISGNSAVSSADSNAGRGGGVMAQSVKTLTMINVTVTGNTAGDSGGGLAVTGGAVGLLSSDISSNTINTGSCTDGKIFANEFFSTGSAFFPTICTDATDTSGSGFCLGDSALTACASPPSSPPFSVPSPPAVPPRSESLCIDRCGGITCLALNAPPHNWKCETVEASCKGCGSDAACSPAASDYPAASYAALDPETALFGAMKYGACYGVTSEFVVSGALSTWTSDPDGYPDYARRALLTTVERTAAIRSAFAAAANALSFDVTPHYKTFNSDYTTIELDIEFMTSDQASAASSALASGAFASTQALEQVFAAEGLSISVLEITVAPGQFGCEAVCHTKSCTGYDAQIKTMCGLCPAKECGTVFGETCCNPGSSDWPLETWGNSWVYRCCETSDDCPTGQFCASECAMYGKCEQEAYVCYPCSYGFLGGAVREADILVPGTTSCALAEAGETLGMTRHELTSDPMSCDQACSAERTYSLHNATCKAVSAPDATSNPMGFCGASGIWPGRWQYKCPDGTFAEGTTGRPDDAPQGKGCHPQLACCDGNTERDMSAVCPEGTYHAGRCGDCAPCGTCCGEYVRSDLPLGHPAKHCPAGTAGAGTCGFGDVPGNICDPKPSGLASAFTWLNATWRLAVYGFVAFVSLSILLAAYKLHIVDKRPQGAKVCKKVPAAAINFGLFLTLPQMVVNLLASIEGAESGDVRVPFAVVAVLGTVDFGFKFWHLWAIDRKDASGRKEMTNQTKARLRFIYGDHMTRSKHDFWHSWLKATVALWQLLFTIYGVLLFIMLASLDELGQANLLGVKKTWGGIFDGNGGLLVTSVSGVVSKRQFQVVGYISEVKLYSGLGYTVFGNLFKMGLKAPKGVKGYGVLGFAANAGVGTVAFLLPANDGKYPQVPSTFLGIALGISLLFWALSIAVGRNVVDSIIEEEKPKSPGKAQVAPAPGKASNQGL